MKAVAIIPARMGSTRFPGKPLAKLLGMPMVGHCYFRSKLAQSINEVYVATCDSEIAEYIESIGGDVILTSDQHTRAATRTVEALQKLELDEKKNFSIVVMVQGDEPLVPPDAISGTLEPFKDSSVSIVNLVSQINDETVFKDHNNVKAVVSRSGNVLYFSREPIPSDWASVRSKRRFLQTGVIAFRTEALKKFNKMEETYLERIESIDMNRVLETGDSIRTIAIEDTTLGVDTKEELKIAENLLSGDPNTARYL